MGFRTDAVAGLVALLRSYQADNTDKLKAVYPERPASFPNLPAAYVGDRDERIVHSSGVRTRTLAPSIVIVDNLTDNHQASARRDVLVDELVDLFTATPHAIGGDSVVAPTAVEDGELQIGGEAGPIYLTSTITLGEADKQEGRD